MTLLKYHIDVLCDESEEINIENWDTISQDERDKLMVEWAADNICLRYTRVGEYDEKIMYTVMVNNKEFKIRSVAPSS